MIEYLTEASVNLGLLYLHEPDSTGHTYGPDDPRVLDMVVELDGVLGYLITKLEQHGLFEVSTLKKTYFVSKRHTVVCPETGKIGFSYRCGTIFFALKPKKSEFLPQRGNSGFLPGAENFCF